MEDEKDKSVVSFTFLKKGHLSMPNAVQLLPEQAGSTNIFAKGSISVQTLTTWKKKGV